MLEESEHDPQEPQRGPLPSASFVQQAPPLPSHVVEQDSRTVQRNVPTRFPQSHFARRNFYHNTPYQNSYRVRGAHRAHNPRGRGHNYHAHNRGRNGWVGRGRRGRGGNYQRNRYIQSFARGRGFDFYSQRRGQRAPNQHHRYEEFKSSLKGIVALISEIAEQAR